MKGEGLCPYWYGQSRAVCEGKKALSLIFSWDLASASLSLQRSSVRWQTRWWTATGCEWCNWLLPPLIPQRILRHVVLLTSFNASFILFWSLGWNGIVLSVFSFPFLGIKQKKHEALISRKQRDYPVRSRADGHSDAFTMPEWRNCRLIAAYLALSGVPELVLTGPLESLSMLLHGSWDSFLGSQWLGERMGTVLVLAF